MMVASIVGDVAQNFLSPMLLFFMAGFLIPLLRVEFLISEGSLSGPDDSVATEYWLAWWRKTCRTECR